MFYYFKKFLKSILPKFVFKIYHYFLAYLAAIFYGFPSRKLIVIGVTGTKGKSTVVNLIGRILEIAGYNLSWLSTLNFKLGKKEWLNQSKMTMPGRFSLQRFLKKSLKNNCQITIIETSSEGLAQGRHLWIDYDIAVLTNLDKEHLESHGSFEKYKQAKGKLFKILKKTKKKIINNQKIKKTIVVNLDDPQADYFLNFWAEKKIGYGIKSQKADFLAKEINLSSKGTEFIINDKKFKTHLFGKMNVYNLLAALAVVKIFGVKDEKIQEALDKIKFIPGRLEEIKEGQDFKVFVDYAHNPSSLKSLYQTIFESGLIKPGGKMICLLGAAGGGRDKWKRPIMGQIAAQYCQKIILTNEDPYDEDPNKILEMIKLGILKTKFPISNLFKILDRKQAIKKALQLAEKNDLVIISGKGSEQWMNLGKGKKIPWDDREIVKQILTH